MGIVRTALKCISEKYEKNEIGKEASRLFMIQMMTLVISFLPSILIARSIGPAMKGKYDLFNLLNGYILEFGTFGFGSGLLYYQFSKKFELSRIHGTGVAFSFIIGVVLMIVGMGTRNIWRGMFSGLPDRYIVLAFLVCPFSIYKLILNNILLGMNKAVINYTISLILGIFDFFFVAFLFITHQLTYSALIWLILGETFFVFLVGAGYIYSKAHSLKCDFFLMYSALKYGIVLYVGNMADAILFKIDLVFINYYKGNEAVGLYSVAVRWAEMLFLLDSAIGAASIYKMSTLSEKDAWAVTWKTMKLQSAVSGTMGIVMVFAAYPLIYLLYGQAYLKAALPLILLLPGIVLWSLGKIMGQFITYKIGKAKYCTYTAVAGAGLNIVLNACLIPLFGIAGAAVSSTVSYGVVVGGLFSVLRFEKKKGEVIENEEI